MIPYYIQRAYQSNDIRDNNIITTDGCCEKEQLNNTIVNEIIQFMYEFCSEDIGYNIQVSSYEDFCDHFWNEAGCMIREWYYIFKIYYFEDKWMEWNIEEYQEQIYLAYTHKYCTFAYVSSHKI